MLETQHLRRMGRKTIGLLGAATLILAACGTPQDVIGPPDEPETPLLRVQYEGGFVPVEHALGTGPSYQLSSDGRLIFAGVTTMEYPGPLVVPYQQVTLSQEDVDRVLALVEEIGLPGMTDERDDTQMNFVADAATYVVTYFDEDGEHKYSVYALGLETEPGSEATQATAELDRLLIGAFRVGGAGAVPGRTDQGLCRHLHDGAGAGLRGHSPLATARWPRRMVRVQRDRLEMQRLPGRYARPLHRRHPGDAMDGAGRGW